MEKTGYPKQSSIPWLAEQNGLFISPNFANAHMALQSCHINVFQVEMLNFNATCKVEILPYKSPLHLAMIFMLRKFKLQNKIPLQCFDFPLHLFQTAALPCVQQIFGHHSFPRLSSQDSHLYSQL